VKKEADELEVDFEEILTNKLKPRAKKAVKVKAKFDNI